MKTNWKKIHPDIGELRALSESAYDPIGTPVFCRNFFDNLNSDDPYAFMFSIIKSGFNKVSASMHWSDKIPRSAQYNAFIQNAIEQGFLEDSEYARNTPKMLVDLPEASKIKEFIELFAQFIDIEPLKSELDTIYKELLKLSSSNPVEQKEIAENSVAEVSLETPTLIFHPVALQTSKELERKAQKSNAKNSKLRKLSEKPWLDIPNTIVDLKENKEFNYLSSMIQKYHLLKKGDKKQLRNRIFLLDYIVKLSDGLMQKSTLPEETKILQKLSTQAYSKSAYLKIISDRELDPLHGLGQIFGGITRNGLHLKRLQQSFWQDPYTLMDPCFRGEYKEFIDLFQTWYVNAEKNPGQTPSFYMWLEENENLTSTIPKKAINAGDNLYQDPGLRLQKLAKINTNKGIMKDKMDTIVCNNKQETYMYAIDENEELYIGHYLFHPYILANSKPILCAGHITILNGKITEITNASGHYRPTPFHLKQAVDLLLKKGVFSETAKVTATYINNQGQQCIFSTTPLQSATLMTIPHYWNIGGQYMNKEEVNQLINASSSNSSMKKNSKH